MPNEKKIRARIVELGLTIKEIAVLMNLTAYTLGKKISGKAPLTLKEAYTLKEILKISDNDFRSYFFSCAVA